jgi:hypothetical protein
LRREAKDRERAVLAQWRKAHPEATCSDAVALALATMAMEVGRL